MTKNQVCKKCKKLPEYYHEVEFVFAAKDKDFYGLKTLILCNDCIREIIEAIETVYPEIGMA